MDKLIEDLNYYFECDLLLKDFDIDKYDLDLKSYVNIEENIYNRNVVYRNDIFEIIVISWGYNSKTPKHNHPVNGCLLKVFDGKLHERLYLDDKVENRLLCKDTVSYLDDTIGTHKIYTLEKGYSLHIYSPPNFYNKTI